MLVISTASQCSSQAYVTSDIDRHNKKMIKSPGDEFIPFPGLFALWRGIGGGKRGRLSEITDVNKVKKSRLFFFVQI